MLSIKKLCIILMIWFSVLVHHCYCRFSFYLLFSLFIDSSMTLQTQWQGGAEGWWGSTICWAPALWWAPTFFCQLALTQGYQVHFPSEVAIIALILSIEKKTEARRVSDSRPEDNLRFELNSSSPPKPVLCAHPTMSPKWSPCLCCIVWLRKRLLWASPGAVA